MKSDEPRFGPYRLDCDAFYLALDVERRQRNLNWKQVGKQCAVSASTLSRLQRGKPPSLGAFLSLVSWLGADERGFISPRPRGSGISSIAVASLAFSRDEHLTPDAAKQLIEMVRTFYDWALAISQCRTPSA